MKENWTYKKLGEVCSKITDGSHNPPKGVPNSNFVMISSQNVYNDRIEINDVRYLSEDDFNREDKRTKVRANDVLLTIVGTVGRCAIVSDDIGLITLQRSVAVLTPKPFVNSRYLMYCCIGHNSTLNTNAHGIAQKGIYLKQLSELKIPVPPIETQSRIVSELDLLQSLIDKQKAQLKELDNLAQAVFYDMFGDPVENEKGWEVKKLGSFCSKIGSGATPRGGNESYKTEGISLIRSLNVHNNEFVYNDLAFIDEEQAQALSNVEVQPNDILLNITGASVARCCIVPNHLLPARVNQHVCIIRPVNEAEVHFLSRLLTNTQYQAFLIDLARGKAATREALPKNIVEGLPIILPPLSLQQSFAAKIESIEKQKAAITQSIAETQRLFDYTMDKYFG